MDKGLIRMKMTYRCARGSQAVSSGMDMAARIDALDLLTTQLISEYLRTALDAGAQTKWARGTSIRRRRSLARRLFSQTPTPRHGRPSGASRQRPPNRRL